MVLAATEDPHFLEHLLGLYRSESESGAMGLLSVRPLRQNFLWSVSIAGPGKWSISWPQLLLGGSLKLSAAW